MAAVCGEAQLATLLQARPALPYAAGYLNQAAYAYGVPITALNAGPLTAGPVAAAPALPIPAVARALPVAAVPALPSVPAVPVAAVKAIAPVAAPAVSSQYQASLTVALLACKINFTILLSYEPNTVDFHIVLNLISLLISGTRRGRQHCLRLPEHQLSQAGDRQR